MPNRPRYVILRNFDEFWAYDYENQLDEPVDVVMLKDLPQRGPDEQFHPQSERGVP